MESLAENADTLSGQVARPETDGLELTLSRLDDGLSEEIDLGYTKGLYR